MHKFYEFCHYAYCAIYNYIFISVFMNLAYDECWDNEALWSEAHFQIKLFIWKSSVKTESVDFSVAE